MKHFIHFENIGGVINLSKGGVVLEVYKGTRLSSIFHNKFPYKFPLIATKIVGQKMRTCMIHMGRGEIVNSNISPKSYYTCFIK